MCLLDIANITHTTHFTFFLLLSGLWVNLFVVGAIFISQNVILHPINLAYYVLYLTFNASLFLPLRR